MSIHGLEAEEVPAINHAGGGGEVSEIGHVKWRASATKVDGIKRE